jgi:hypothetical protein
MDNVLNARTGQGHPDGGKFSGALARALALGGVDLARKGHLRARFDSIHREIRGDAFDPSAALHMARDLEHVYTDVLREQFPAQNAFTLFPLDNSVPVGARTHTVRRLFQDGEAKVYRAGLEIPRVGLSQQEEQFPVRHYVNSFAIDLFERLSSQFANFAEAAEKLRVARDVMMEFANIKTWYGDDLNGIYGVLNYPWLPKLVVATPFVSASAADDILAELNSIVNFPEEQSKATFAPNTVVTSPRVRNFLSNTRIAGAVDNTLMKFWLETNSQGITSIEAARELQGVGPGGTDGFLAYRRDRLGIVNVIPQAFTTLPVQSQGFEDMTFAYMSHGGVIMRDVGNNVLAWVDATA